MKKLWRFVRLYPPSNVKMRMAITPSEPMMPALRARLKTCVRLLCFAEGLRLGFRLDVDKRRLCCLEEEAYETSYERILTDMA